MNCPPLAIIQARMGSKRLPGKVLLKLGGETLIERVWRLTCEAFSRENVVVAFPFTEENEPLRRELMRIGAMRFEFQGNEDDVLRRYYECAWRYRWHPDSVIVRVTADEPWLVPSMLRATAAGVRNPVELGGEAFTLKMLARREHFFGPGAIHQREHISHALYDTPAPAAPDGVYSIDTQEDYERAFTSLS